MCQIWDVTLNQILCNSSVKANTKLAEITPFKRYVIMVMVVCRITMDIRASIHKAAARRLTARSREVSKPRDWMLQWSYRSEIWHLGSAAAVVPVKFQSDWKSLSMNLVASRLDGILQQDVLPLSE